MCLSCVSYTRRFQTETRKWEKKHWWVFAGYLQVPTLLQLQTCSHNTPEFRNCIVCRCFTEHNIVKKSQYRCWPLTEHHWCLFSTVNVRLVWLPCSVSSYNRYAIIPQNLWRLFQEATIGWGSIPFSFETTAASRLLAVYSSLSQVYQSLCKTLASGNKRHRKMNIYQRFLSHCF